MPAHYLDDGDAPVALRCRAQALDAARGDEYCGRVAGRDVIHHLLEVEHGLRFRALVADAAFHRGVAHPQPFIRLARVVQPEIVVDRLGREHRREAFGQRLKTVERTVAADGKVKMKAKAGESMPEGWMIDKEGKPLTDPNRSSEGTLLPIGDYKGYGLSLMIALLAGSMNGAAVGSQLVDFNDDEKAITNTGQTIIAINPAFLGGTENLLKSSHQLVSEIKNSQTLPGVS